ncbi:MAG: FAD-dependent oxidoreductase, partial [Trueperaceae bacterium]
TGVVVLEAGPRVASREDPEVADAVRTLLEDEGVEIRTGTTVQRVGRDGDGVVVTVSDGTGDAEETIHGSHLLLAAGRVPNTNDIGLDVAGVEVDERGFAKVDERCRTTVDGVRMLGDANGRGAFTHTAVHDAEIVLDDLRGADSARTLGDRRTVYALFTDPPLGRWGMTERQAIEAGHRVKVARRPMAKIARAKEEGRTEGLIKLVVDADDERLLGTTTFGLHGDELANLFAVFGATGQPWTTLRRTVLVHPTVAELVPWMLDDLKLVEA